MMGEASFGGTRHVDSDPRPTVGCVSRLRTRSGCSGGPSSAVQLVTIGRPMISMPTPGRLGLLLVALLPACDGKLPDTTNATGTPATLTVAPTSTTTVTATTTTTASGQTVAHIRVSLRKVSIGKVPLKAADGSIGYADEPRLMI